MTTKEWLNRAYKLNKEINRLLEEKEKAFLQACKVTSALSPDKVQTSNGNGSERKLLKLAEYDEELNNCIDNLYKVKTDIYAVIKTVPDAELRKLLSKRYIDFKSFRKIRKETNIPISTIHRLLDKSIEIIEKTQKVV